jgi:hypothetical protein
MRPLANCPAAASTPTTTTTSWAKPNPVRAIAAAVVARVSSGSRTRW